MKSSMGEDGMLSKSQISSGNVSSQLDRPKKPEDYVWEKIFPPSCFGKYTVCTAPTSKYSRCQDGCEWELACNLKWLEVKWLKDHEERGRK